MSSTVLKSSAGARLRSAPVIAATVALTGGVAGVQGSLASAALCGLLVIVLVPCALIDIELRIIPNRITGPAALVAIALGLALAPGSEPQRLLWAALAGGFLLIAALASPSGMGMGDVKLLAVMGLCLGRPVMIALFVALLGSVVAGLVLARRRGIAAARKTALPFGPYLALGGIVAAVAGERLINAWLGLHF